VKKKTHHHGTELVLWYNSQKIIDHTFGTFRFALRHNFLGVCSALQIICVVLFIPGYPAQPPTQCLKILLKTIEICCLSGEMIVSTYHLSFASKHKLVVIIVDDQLLFLLIESHAQRAAKPTHKLCHHYSFDNLFFAFVNWVTLKKSC